MPDARECRQQANALTRLTRTDIDPRTVKVLVAMAVSWRSLAGHMDRLETRDHSMARRLAQAQWWGDGL